MLFFIIFWKKTLMIDNVTHDTMTLCCYIIIEKSKYFNSYICFNDTK